MRDRCHIIAIALLFTACLTGCGKRPPAVWTDQDSYPAIFPDYTEVTVPCNIAPLNFTIEEEGDRFLTVITTTAGTVSIHGRNVQVALGKWRKLLQPGPMQVEVYAERDGGWNKFRTATITVSPHPIDEYITYRLIQPGYVLYENMAIVERRLTDFSERDIFNNGYLRAGDKPHCINCHTPGGNDPGRSLFHVRGSFGGTVINRDGEFTKVDLKTDSTLSAGVYPAWHPDGELIAFSVNSTYQAFHREHTDKVEVQDSRSALIIYNTRTNTVQAITDPGDTLTTFPAWSPDGRTLYFTAAHYPAEGRDRNTLTGDMLDDYDSIRYDLMKMDFDPVTMAFGYPETVYAASADGKSVSLPRVSPDGRYLMFACAAHGNFHVWHGDSDLWLLDLTTGEVRPMNEVNSPRSESYHSWSSDGKWVVFGSRRDDGSYTRVYIAAFDPDTGYAGKPFMMPLKYPQRDGIFNYSFNLPELLTGPVPFSAAGISGTVSAPAVKAVWGGGVKMIQKEVKN